MHVGSVCTRTANAINRYPGRTITVLSALYFFLAIALSSLKLFWFDEFITFYIAKLNSAHAIWAALARGADPNPPLSHVLVMTSMRLFGDGPLAVRLPAMIFAWLGIFCLYVFLQRRLPAIYAAIGVCYAMATFAFTYSYESRSYPLMLGFAMLSLVLWREAAEGPRRSLAAIGLALALAGGISSNYFAVLAFFPIAIGELVRSIERRRLDWRIWIALAAGAAPLLAYLPLIHAGVARFAPYAWNRVKPDAIIDSYDEMMEVILYPALLLLAAGVIAWLYQHRDSFKPNQADQHLAPLLARMYERRSRVTRPVLPRHELAAVITVMAYPIFGYLIAVARAGMLSPRFVLPVCYGFAMALAVTAYRLFSRNAVAAVALLFVLLSWGIARDIFAAFDLYDQRQAFYRIRDTLPATGTIAVTDALLVLPLHYYSPPQLASRLVIPLDFSAIRKYKGEDSPEQNLWAGRDGIYPVPIVSLEQFQNTTPNYLILTTKRNWLLQQLDAEGMPAHKLTIDSDSKDITGAFPLSHAATFVWEEGNILDHQYDKQYASTPASTGAGN